MSDSTMTPDKAEALGKLSADLLQVMFNASHADPDLGWTDLAMAAALAIRGLAARECANNPALPRQVADFTLMTHFAKVMALPPESVRAVIDDTPGPDTTGIIPVQRH